MRKGITRPLHQIEKSRLQAAFLFAISRAPPPLLFLALLLVVWYTIFIHPHFSFAQEVPT